jgi:D-xylose 1-dehydrogenase (NADP+, D-xylono-1,5-lactone-forming)
VSGDRVSWGVLSTARINADVVPCLVRSETSEIVAIASRDAERAERHAAAYGIERAYGSYEALLADGSIECIYLPLPNALHGEWTEAALRAGKHVLCEKPLTPTAAEARMLFALARESGLVLGEAFAYRHHAQTLRLRELMSEGTIGEPRLIRATFTFTVADPEHDIRYDPALAGGALRDVGCYAVDISNFLVGCPNEVIGFADWAATGVDAAFYGTLIAAGCVTQFDCSLEAPLRVSLTVVGSEGELHVPTPWYPHLPPQTIEHRDTSGTVRELPAPGENSYLLEISNFADAVRGRAPLLVAPQETVENLATIEALLSDAGTRSPLPQPIAEEVR